MSEEDSAQLMSPGGSSEDSELHVSDDDSETGISPGGPSESELSE